MNRFALIALLVLLPSVTIAGRRGGGEGPTQKELEAQVLEVFGDLEGNSDGAVRRIVFKARLGMNRKTAAAAVAAAIGDGDWTIQREALGRALSGRDRKVKAAAEKIVAKDLESADDDERARGYEILDAHYKKKRRINALQRAAKDGTPPARSAARKALVKVGGKIGWKVISQGLAEEPDSPEYKEALEALATWTDGLAYKWAIGLLHDGTELGMVARDVLARIEGRRVVKKLERALRKDYENANDFAPRVDGASVLARRGASDVTRTLRLGVTYKESDHVRRVAWTGMVRVRDTRVLAKLRERILTNQDDREADAAYAWLEAWARQSADPKVIGILQEAARSDRRGLRMRALGVLTRIAHRPSQPIFLSAMREGQAEVRAAGAKGLAAVARPEDIKTIARLMRKEPSMQVKLALVEALGKIGDASIVAPLQFLVTAPQQEMKRAVVQAVAATGRPEAATLLRLLKREPNLETRFMVWQQLLRLDPKSIAGELPGAIGWLTPSQIELLAKDRGVGVETLEFIANKGTDLQRPFAVEGLEGRGEKAATRLLSLLERSPHPDTAAAALRALAKVRQRKSMKTYRSALKSKHAPVRAEAYRAIGAYGRRDLLPAALDGLEDKEPLVRALAAQAALELARRKE